jgi:hypothetical protein
VAEFTLGIIANMKPFHENIFINYSRILESTLRVSIGAFLALGDKVGEASSFFTSSFDNFAESCCS